MHSSTGSALGPRARGFFSVIGLGLVGFVAVATAMTVLGNTPPDFTAEVSPTPSPSVSYVPPSPTTSPTEYVGPVATAKLPATPPQFSTMYTAVKDKQGAWSITWRYPAIRSGTTPLAAQVNADILGQVQFHVGTFQAGPAAVQQVPGKTNTMNGNFTVEMNARDLLSLTLRWTENVPPTQETPNIQTLNYSLATGQPLTFDDLFSDQPAALLILTTESRKQLQAVLGADYDAAVVEAGTDPSTTSFSNWSLTTGGLVITFPVYQVAPFEDGTPSVRIPWQTLAPVMDPNGAAGRLAGLTPLPTPLPPAGWTPHPPTPEPTDTPDDFPTDEPLPEPS